MKHLKKFNESTEEKLFVLAFGPDWEIPDSDEGYNELNTVDFNRNYAKIILDTLCDEWIGKLVRHSGLWLDLNTNSGDKSVSIFQTEDDYFMCDYVYDDDMRIYKCDTFDGLLQFLKSEDIIM